MFSEENQAVAIKHESQLLFRIHVTDSSRKILGLRRARRRLGDENAHFGLTLTSPLVKSGPAEL
jgi:hypothetical protein